jgi:hypothetical protein
MSFKIGGSYSASNVVDIVFLLENTPETMLPLLLDSRSELFTYLEIMGLSEQADEIRRLLEEYPDVDRIGNAAVILQNRVIKPFKLARYADFELATLEQIQHVPKDPQSHILNMASEKSYDGGFLPWLELLSPNIPADDMKTGGWKEFLVSIAGN